MRNVILVVCLVAGATGAAGQDIEIGGSVAAACLGSDGSLCGSGTLTCRPVGCGGVPGLPPEGAHRRWLSDAILIAGLSGIVRDRWVWRGGWLSHRFANDDNSTIETFVGMGYRFGKR